MSFSHSHKKGKPLECVAGKLSSKQVKNVVTLAGAGISTSAGICDLRSPETGLYHQLRKYKIQYADVMWDKNYFYNHPETLYRILKDNFFHNPLKPTLTHCFIKLLEMKGILLRHFTQNIDGMEAMTGLAPEKLVEAHGTIHRAYCVACKAPYSFQWLVSKVDEHPVPFCDVCGGLVRPDIVLFGEELSMNFRFRAFIDLPECDFLIVLGTSLQVEPFSSLANDIPFDCPRIVINRNLPAELKNGRTRSSYKDPDDADDLFVGGDCDNTIIELVRLMGWEEDLHRVVRDVKLKKLYGDVKYVDVAAQTAPWSENDSVGSEMLFDPDYGKSHMKCEDYRVASKAPLERPCLPAPKPSGNAAKQVDSLYKAKGSSTKSQIEGPTVTPRSQPPKSVQTDDPLRFCIKCYNPECHPTKYATRKK